MRATSLANLALVTVTSERSRQLGGEIAHRKVFLSFANCCGSRKRSELVNSAIKIVEFKNSNAAAVGNDIIILGSESS